MNWTLQHALQGGQIYTEVWLMMNTATKHIQYLRDGTKEAEEVKDKPVKVREEWRRQYEPSSIK